MLAGVRVGFRIKLLLISVSIDQNFALSLCVSLFYVVPLYKHRVRGIVVLHAFNFAK